jgi:pimeloyl-ACP methyl ester carboxylesterase
MLAPTLIAEELTVTMIEVRDTTLYYRNSGAGPESVFVHGMCGDADVWRGQVDRLAGRFTCITYDRRGHTRSQRGTEPESTQTHAADLAVLIEQLGLDRPIVVGSSGGARITLETARTRPELLAGAVLSEPPIFSLASGPPAGPAIAEIVQRAAAQGGPAAAVDAFFPLICPGLWSQLDEAAKNRYRANAPMMLAEFAGPQYAPTVEDIHAIGLPCLVISGTASHPALQQIASTLAGELPDARFVPLEGSGHVTYAEAPSEFARAVAAFARELASPAPAR